MTLPEAGGDVQALYFSHLGGNSWTFQCEMIFFFFLSSFFMPYPLNSCLLTQRELVPGNHAGEQDL